MFPTLHIGSLAIQVPGLLILIGLWLGLSLAERYSPKRGIPAAHIYTFSITAVLAAAFSARLIYVFLNLNVFLDSPASIVSLNPELLNPFGALLGVALVFIYFLRRYKYNPWSFIDALVPILAVLTCAVDLANLASGKGYGYPTNLPWAIYLFGEWRHPTQIYEIIAATIILVSLWPGSHRTLFSQRGIYGLCVIAATATSRLILEAFRADSNIISGGIRSAQITAWLLLAVTLWLLFKRLGISNG